MKGESKMYGIYINCSKYPFIRWIKEHKKLFETRNKNTLKQFIGERVYLIETGKGKNIVSCSCVIESVMIIDNLKQWAEMRKYTKIRKNSMYEMKQGKKKYLYKITDIMPCEPFIANGKRCGYTYQVL
jgi:hypothetical protein